MKTKRRRVVAAVGVALFAGALGTALVRAKKRKKKVEKKEAPQKHIRRENVVQSAENRFDGKMHYPNR